MEAIFSHIIAGVLLSGILYVIRGVSGWWLGQEAMGLGDVKLAFAMGLLLGVANGLLAVYSGFVLGGLVSIVLILLRQRGVKSKIAFGPFLVVGTVLMLFFEREMLALFHRIFWM